MHFKKTTKHVFVSALVIFSTISSPILADSLPLSVQVACAQINTAPYSAYSSLVIEKKDGRRTQFQVEIADSFVERNQGMMCRSSMAKNYGMLFLFPDSADRSFWMKNTLISLDIIYVGANGRIVSIQKKAKPLDTTPLPSKGKAVAVFEVQGGLTDQLKIKSGDRLIHPFFATRP